jgi:hypothetical protein
MMGKGRPCGEEKPYIRLAELVGETRWAVQIPQNTVVSVIVVQGLGG